MLQSKYVVVEVSTTTATMTLVQYLITHGFDKFAVVSDLCDHPSLKYKSSINGTTTTGTSNSNTATNSSSSSSSSTSSTSSTVSTNGKPKNVKVSINDIAQALSKRSSPTSEQSNGFSNTNNVVRASTPSTPVTNNHSALTKILEDKSRQTLEQQKEQERQQLEIQRIILGHVASVTETEERVSPEINEFETAKKDQIDEDTEVKTESSDSVDFGLGPSDEQVRASMIHLLNPVLGSAFGLLQSAQLEETNTRRRSEYSPATKKHRWMTNGELEESRFGRGKNYGRVHCKATYKCALCGKPTTLNSTGSRWNLLRHVIMIHSESKPYQCFDCDFNGIKSNVISHARQSGHRCDDAFDITTDEMRAEWNAMLHACFPDYVKAKTRGWQSEENTPKETSTTENEVEA